MNKLKDFLEDANEYFLRKRNINLREISSLDLNLSQKMELLDVDIIFNILDAAKYEYGINLDEYQILHKLLNQKKIDYRLNRMFRIKNKAKKRTKFRQKKNNKILKKDIEYPIYHWREEKERERRKFLNKYSNEFLKSSKKNELRSKRYKAKLKIKKYKDI